ncbi:hypothetical protein JTE90_017003 [Oedothorax gibbosus]|uniref:Uncharacterized protein n=1 Tax=Oedothorax gibbosus TaxID=931172 RepID=A0AAV6THB0_9ARAC|nr:hypothetical protein JTE90_017003 [Oedothorax gibbosus]
MLSINRLQGCPIITTRVVRTVSLHRLDGDSDLEAFSHNPTDGSFAPLASDQAHEPSVPRTCGSSRTERITIATDESS